MDIKIVKQTEDFAVLFLARMAYIDINDMQQLKDNGYRVISIVGCVMGGVKVIVEKIKCQAE